MSSKKAANKQWGGRFDQGPDEIMERINASIDFDRRLYRQDIAGSLAHAKMLVHKGILTAEDGAQIEQGLNTISREIEAGKFVYDVGLEDIHMNIEARLKELIGDAAGRLHTARSRNDQVATDFRLYGCAPDMHRYARSAALLELATRPWLGKAEKPMPMSRSCRASRICRAPSR